MTTDDLPAGYGARLPDGIRARYVPGINGMRMHVLEAGYESPGRPCLLLLHGFPELAYSWRRVMVPLAEAGYHVIAPDQRGYGRTTGWDGTFDTDLGVYRLPNLVRDAMALVYAFGYRSVHAVIGHDFGSPVAAWASIIRPDVFRSVALMSAPAGGPPPMPFDTLAQGLPAPTSTRRWPRCRGRASTTSGTTPLARPTSTCGTLRRVSTISCARTTTTRAPTGRRIVPADELAKMPTYYVMDLDQDMAQTVAPHMPSRAQIEACRWLPDEDLAVYSGEYGRIGFQGGLQWYRVMTGPQTIAELQLYSGRTIDTPSCFIAGRSDWGVYQRPGDFEKMQSSVCTNMKGCHLLDGAGHWVQQEQPENTVEALLDFLKA